MITLAYGVMWLYVMLRLVKLGLVAHFFRRQPFAPPAQLPTLSLTQPISRGATNLEGNLASRLQSRYPETIQHIWVCDEADLASQQVCQRVIAQHPHAHIELVRLASQLSPVAPKIEKLNAGLDCATGEVLVFIDDDIEVEPRTLTTLITHLLHDEDAGVTFGLARAASWNNAWSAMNSLFVNLHALPTYVPLTYFTDPFAITGHLYAVHRTDFERVGGFTDMDNRLDDDYELAVRLQRDGRRCVQTRALYSVHNEFDNAQAYLHQVQRWFVFPRRCVTMTCYQSGVTALLSLDVFLPALGLLLVPVAGVPLLLIGIAALVSLTIINRLFLHQMMPLTAWLLLPLVIFVTPFHILYTLLLLNDTVTWRGQRLHVQQGGYFEVIEK